MKLSSIGGVSRALFALLLALSSCTMSATSSANAPTIAPHGSRYSTRGVIRGFGPSREYVNIAHQDIPGYMRAMTMAFEFESPAQSAGLSVGDAVRITFEELPEGRFVLRAIARE